MMMKEVEEEAGDPAHREEVVVVEVAIVDLLPVVSPSYPEKKRTMSLMIRMLQMRKEWTLVKRMPRSGWWWFKV
jgi:hypothetical protein